MSSNGIILPLSWADSLAITASSAASSDLAAENLLGDQPSEPWRSSGSGAHTISGDFGQTRACDTFCLWAHNLDTVDSVQLELASEPTFDSGDANYVSHSWPGRYAMDPWGQQLSNGAYLAPYVVEIFTQVLRRYWRITITRAGGYSEAGRLMIGEGWQPALNMAFGLDIGWVDPSGIRRAKGGQLYSRSRPRYREGTLTYQWLDKTDGTRAWDDIVYTVGKNGTVLVIPYPDELHTTFGRHRTVLARVVDIGKPQHYRRSRWQASMRIEEAL